MIIIEKEENCCGCTACYSICPNKAITMEEDSEGFKYPKIDKDKCIDCNLCKKVCPVLNRNKNSSLKKAKIIRVNNKEILNQSTSGGFFTPLSNFIINNKGYVFGAVFEGNKITHKYFNRLEEIELFRGSKYVQSDLNDSFITIKKLLKEDNYVLFSGTPCQVSGLKSYLKKSYEKLLTVDVICHGTPSPLLFRKYVEYMEKKYNSKIKKINFRNKTYGYHVGTMKIEFENGKKYYGSARIDYMLKSFFTEISSRPSCYECKFKSKEHISDFTIFDCWSASKINNAIKDDDKGFTNLIINSKKGDKIFKVIEKQYEVYDSDLEKAILLDGIMVEHNAIKNDNRDNFYNCLNANGLEKCINKYIPVTTKDRLIEKSKNIFYKLGLLKIIKKIKS